jgi:hypothetical protein
MKQIFLVCTALGLMLTNAKAQKSSQYDINYKICKVHDKYDACGEHDPTVISEPKPTDNKAAVAASLRRLDTHVNVKPSSENRQISFKGNPRFSVLYDDPNGAYEGKETRINDGVQKNVHRNINYLDNSVDLPPNDGNSSTTTKR